MEAPKLGSSEETGFLVRISTFLRNWVQMGFKRKKIGRLVFFTFVFSAGRKWRRKKLRELGIFIKVLPTLILC